MLDELTLQNATNVILRHIEELTSDYIIMIAEQIAAIGGLNPSSVNRLILMMQWGKDINDITQRLAVATQKTAAEIAVLYQEVLNDTYSDPRFAEALKHTEITEADQARILKMAITVRNQTLDQLSNLSNTTAVSSNYKDAVDKAVIAVSSGMTDYSSAARQVLREVGGAGIPVVYSSGYKRRADSAVRQNIVDGANQIAQQASDMIGEALGYDAVEISVHAMSAPDHEPIQGHVFLKAEYEKMQNGEPFEDVDGHQFEAIKRPIGEWNCRHFAMSFSTQYSKRKYTDEQLADIAKKNEEGCDIDGKHYTKYGASQLMRQIETEIRKQKDIAIAAAAAGDEDLQAECQNKINELTAQYYSVARQAGLTPQRDRLQVPGFKIYKPGKK